MIVMRILLIVMGVVSVMLGAQLPWGEVDAGEITIPLTFFLDIGAIGNLLSVIGVALAGLSLSDRTSDRSVGALLVIFGLSIAAGSGVLMALIDQQNLDLAPGFPAVDSVILGPGGFVAVAGGIVIAIAGLLFLVAPLPPGPPILAGGPGEVPSGWYPVSPRSDVVGYWNGTRWSHQRHWSENWTERPGVIRRR